MNTETLKALKESIAHWKRMKANRDCGERPSAYHCSLCRMFIDENCAGCPVSKHTKLRYCVGSPFSEAHLQYYQGSDRRWRTAAQREIDFLESLLPKQTSRKRK